MVEENLMLVYFTIHSFLQNSNGSYLLNFYDFEDIVGICNLALCRAVKTYNPKKAQISTWVRRVVYGQLKSLLDYSVNRVVLVHSEPDVQVVDENFYDENYGDPALILNSIMEKQLINQAVENARLSRIENSVIDLVVKKGLKQVDVAKILNKPEYTVSRLKISALRRIKDEYLYLIS